MVGSEGLEMWVEMGDKQRWRSTNGVGEALRHYLSPGHDKVGVLREEGKQVQMTSLESKK